MFPLIPLIPLLPLIPPPSPFRVFRGLSSSPFLNRKRALRGLSEKGSLCKFRVKFSGGIGKFWPLV